LLDVKNELLLSYLQNLVFLILVKIRDAKATPPSRTEEPRLRDSVVRTLVELRLYLEKGVRPLEEKLRYQVEKAIRAADDLRRNAEAEAERDAQEAKRTDDGGKGPPSDSEDGSSEEGGDDGDDSLRESETRQAAPNRGAFLRPSANSASASKNSTDVYRPPKIAPTAMPTIERRQKAERTPIKSATMDDFIANEFSSAPIAEPSIGANIGSRGRHVKTASERRVEEERREYEERNFVRLPRESKKDSTKKSKLEGRSGRMSFGGEEWRELGEGVDRINRLTKSKDAGRGAKALLDKSRKRGIETVDGPRGSGSSGVQIGERYNKRLKVQELGRRDRGQKGR